jgi:hypothetical protein
MDIYIFKLFTNIDNHNHNDNHKKTSYKLLI